MPQGIHRVGQGLRGGLVLQACGLLPHGVVGPTPPLHAHQVHAGAPPRPARGVGQGLGGGGQAHQGPGQGVLVQQGTIIAIPGTQGTIQGAGQHLAGLGGVQAHARHGGRVPLECGQQGPTRHRQHTHHTPTRHVHGASITREAGSSR